MSLLSIYADFVKRIRHLVGFAPDNDQELYATVGPGRPKLRSRTMRIATAVNQRPNLHAETQAADSRLKE